MAIFIIGLCIGICLCCAGGVTLLRTAFARITLKDLPMGDDPAKGSTNAKEIGRFHTLVSRQDLTGSSLMVAYGFFVATALILMTHYLLGALNGWQIALHCVLLPCFLVLLTDVLPRSYLLRQPVETLPRLLPYIHAVTLVFQWPAKALAFTARHIGGWFKPSFQALPNLWNTFESYALVSRFYQAESALSSPEKRDYVIQQSLGRFASMPVSALMIPVRQLKLMDASLEVDALLEQAFNTNAKRILLYQDQPENIIGILHVSLLMKSFCLAEGNKETTDITSAISEPVFISPDKPVLIQFQDFSTQQTQYALVRDERDYIKGAIDLETILESLAADLKQNPV